MAWITTPFRHHQVAPLQSLLSVAARIPGILERIDALSGGPSHNATETAKERITELAESRAHLEDWHSAYLRSTSSPLYWRQTAESDNEGKRELLWYRDLSTANVFTYFWAFQLICLTSTQSLLEKYPSLDRPVLSIVNNVLGPRDLCIKLSIQIYQSMEYVLRDDFMLYGVSSASFPLQTACSTLDLDGEGRNILKSLDETIIVRSKI